MQNIALAILASKRNSLHWSYILNWILKVTVRSKSWSIAFPNE